MGESRPHEAYSNKLCVLRLLLIVTLLALPGQISGILMKPRENEDAMDSKDDMGMSANDQQKLRTDVDWRDLGDDTLKPDTDQFAAPKALDHGESEFLEESLLRTRRSPTSIKLVGRLYPEPSSSALVPNEKTDVQRDAGTRSPTPGALNEVNKLDLGPLQRLLDQALHGSSLKGLRRKKVLIAKDKSTRTTANHLPRQRRDLEQAETIEADTETDEALRGAMDAITAVLQKVFRSAIDKWIKTVLTLRERVALRIIKITEFEDTHHLSEALTNFNITRNTPLFLIAGGIRANFSDILPQTFTSVSLDQLLQPGDAVTEEKVQEVTRVEANATTTSTTTELPEVAETPVPEPEPVESSPPKNESKRGLLDETGIPHLERDLVTRPAPPTVPPFHTIPDPDMKDDTSGSGVKSKPTVFKPFGAARESDDDDDDDDDKPDDDDKDSNEDSDENTSSGSNSTSTSTSTPNINPVPIPPTLPAPVLVPSSSTDSSATSSSSTDSISIETSTSGTSTSSTEPSSSSTSRTEPSGNAENLDNTSETATGTEDNQKGDSSTDAPLPSSTEASDAIKTTPELFRSRSIEIPNWSILEARSLKGFGSFRQGRSQVIGSSNEKNQEIHLDTDAGTPIQNPIQITDILISDGDETEPISENENTRQKRSFTPNCPGAPKETTKFREIRESLTATASTSQTAPGSTSFPLHYVPLNAFVAKPSPSFGVNHGLKPSKYTTIFSDSHNIGHQPNYTLVVIPPPLIQSPPHHSNDSMSAFLQTLARE